jgi:hypothetical protein
MYIVAKQEKHTRVRMRDKLTRSQATLAYMSGVMSKRMNDTSMRPSSGAHDVTYFFFRGFSFRRKVTNMS